MKNLEKIKVRLHYASVKSNEINIHYFDRKSIFIDWLEQIRENNKQKKVVYLLATDNDSEIFVSDNIRIVEKLFTDANQNCMFPIDLWNDEFFLQEYESFESAYAVALGMKEEHPLCYDKDLTELN